MGSISPSSASDRRSGKRKLTPKRNRTLETRPVGGARLSNERALEFEVNVYLRVCEGFNTPRSLSCYLLAKAGEWLQLFELQDCTTSHKDFSTFSADYVCSEMMRKNSRLLLGIDRSDVAIQSFLDSEEQCRLTNERFLDYRENPSKFPKECTRISRVAQILSATLGPVSRGKLDRMERNFRYGPGATSALSGRDVVLSKKYTCQGQVTPRLLPYLNVLRSTLGEPSVESLIHHSTVVTVPKNAKTDRTICIEPHYNIRYQLGLATILRDALVRLGLEPNNQDRNRQMAKTALADGYATIDLKAASDTIAKQVVLDLIPYEWFQLLLIGRTDCTLLPNGSTIVLEKFSAMGNGYTWELESLIFYAVARSLTDKPLGVFGDDLVVPVEIVEELFETLELFGFKVNSKKSFWRNDFRESCGSDFYLGKDVRPFFLRKESEDLYDLPHFAIHVSNGIRILAHRLGGFKKCDERLLLAYKYASGYARKLNTFLSYGYGDDGLLVNKDECPDIPRGRGFQGYVSKVYRRRSLRSKRTDPFGAYLAALDKGSLDESRLVEYERGALGAPSLRRLPVFDWYHLGPWSAIT